MGLWSWLFPTEADRVRKARKLLDNDDPGTARLELEGLESPEALALWDEVMAALVAKNLAMARDDVASEAFEDAAERIALAERFAKDRFKEELREARRDLREGRVAARALAEAAMAAPSAPESPSPGFKGDPLYSLPPDDPRLRYALLLEGYSAELRERSLALGAEYARAVLALEDGQAEVAWLALAAFVDRDPVARFERARAAMALGRRDEAIADLVTFGDVIGHCRMGASHTVALLAGLYMETGRLDLARQLLEQAVGQDPKELNLAGMLGSVLEGQGRLPEAEARFEDLLRRVPKDGGVARALARIRVTLGKRRPAMAVLESSLASTCTTPGKCGFRPPDVDAMRMLARLYAEDAIETQRVDELLGQVREANAGPTWEDAYVEALQLRNRKEPGVVERVQEMLRPLPANDPRRDWVRERFGHLF